MSAISSTQLPPPNLNGLEDSLSSPGKKVEQTLEEKVSSIAAIATPILGTPSWESSVLASTSKLLPQATAEFIHFLAAGSKDAVQLKTSLHCFRGDHRPYSVHFFSNGSICVKLKTNNQWCDSGASKTKKYAVNLSTKSQDAFIIIRLVAHELKAIEKVKNEYKLLQKFLGVRGIVQVFGTYDSVNKKGKPTFTLYEQMSNQGDAIAFIRENKDAIFKAGVFPALVEDWMHGLQALHAQGIAHRDIKLQNLLVHQEEGRTEGRICDLDRAVAVNDANLNISGTMNMFAPEKAFIYVHLQSKQNKWSSKDEVKADIWSLGVSLFQLFYFSENVQLPWLGEAKSSMLQRLSDYTKKSHPSFFNQPPVAAHVAHLIWEMCQVSPDLRPTMDQVISKWNSIPAGEKELPQIRNS